MIFAMMDKKGRVDIYKVITDTKERPINTQVLGSAIARFHIHTVLSAATTI